MVAELVYAYASEAYPARVGSSTLPHGTKFRCYNLKQMSLGVRHIAKRKKARHVKGFPTRASILKDALDIIIYPIAVAAPLALLPQIIKLYTTHDTASLSLPTWILLGLVNCAWLLYGYIHHEHPIVISSGVFVLFHFSIVLGILLFR